MQSTMQHQWYQFSNPHTEGILSVLIIEVCLRYTAVSQGPPLLCIKRPYKVFQKPSGRVGVVKQASLTNVEQFVKQCCRIAVKPVVCGVKNVQVWFHSFNQEFYMPTKTKNCSNCSKAT